MDSEVTVCGICLESYNEGSRKPLVLPCSHSFCRDCLNKLDSRGNKTCSTCRTSWNNTSVDELLGCYQLIPTEGGGIAPAEEREKCLQHDERVTTWCKTCSKPACIKCLQLGTHKTCTLVDIQNREDRQVQEHYEKAIASLSENILRNSKTVGTLTNLSDFVVVHKEVLASWGMEACELSNVDQSNFTFSGTSKELLRTMKEVQAQCKKLTLSAPPTSLLYHIATAYQDEGECDSEEFVKKFRESVTAASAAGPSADLASHVNAPPSFKPDEIWTIRNTAEGSEAARILRSTCVRPSLLVVTGISWRPRALIQLLTEASEIRRPVRLQFLDGFWIPSTRTAEQTRARLDTLLKTGHRCSLQQVLGHFDGDGIEKLPNTLESVGLVLRNSQDLNVAHALFSRIVEDSEQLPQLTEIHLSFLKSFMAAECDLDFPVRGAKFCFVRLLNEYNIGICLHFTRLRPTDVDWMQAVLRKVTEDFQERRIIKKLFLPGISLPSDQLLGILKDCQLSCEVHLPFDQLNTADRYDVANGYADVGCSVVWDLESLGFFWFPFFR